MLKTSFPDVAGAAQNWRVKVYQQRCGLATPRRSNAPHKFMTPLERDALCARLERQAAK